MIEPDDAIPARFTGLATFMSGRIMIAEDKEQDCRVSFSSPDEAIVTTEAIGRTGAEAICYLDGIGALSGRIEIVHATGFMLRLCLSDGRRARVAARVAWHTKQNERPVEQRNNPRIVPLHRAVVIRLPDGSIVDGRILDLSKSGAKIALAASMPPIADVLIVVGKRYATVVRVEGASIAVQFRLPFCDGTFNPTVVL